jgi:hypothetical protein
MLILFKIIYPKSLLISFPVLKPAAKDDRKCYLLKNLMYHNMSGQPYVIRKVVNLLATFMSLRYTINAQSPFLSES